jgi:hypothetical protein
MQSHGEHGLTSTDARIPATHLVTDAAAKPGDLAEVILYLRYRACIDLARCVVNTRVRTVVGTRRRSIHLCMICRVGHKVRQPLERPTAQTTLGLHSEASALSDAPISTRCLTREAARSAAVLIIESRNSAMA